MQLAPSASFTPLLLLSLLLGACPAAASVAHPGSLHVHDSAHMFEHMEHLSIKPPEHTLSESEQEYYYFKMHDFDNNNKLDGLEVLKSLLDHESKEKSLSDQLLEQAVNEVLKSEDINGDGYIDYSEFVASQRKADSRSNV